MICLTLEMTLEQSCIMKPSPKYANSLQVHDDFFLLCRFSATEWPNGHYVHTLSGLKEEPMSYHFWLLYKLKSCPDPQSPPSNQLVAPTGVDDLIVQNGEHYLFWYKKL